MHIAFEAINKFKAYSPRMIPFFDLDKAVCGQSIQQTYVVWVESCLFEFSRNFIACSPVKYVNYYNQKAFILLVKVLILFITPFETVNAGHFYASPRASGLLFTGRADVNTTELNQTDIEILRLIDWGFTPKEIAAKLEITSRTVYRSRSKLRTLLGVSTNEQIVSAARQKGLLDEQDGG